MKFDSDTMEMAAAPRGLARWSPAPCSAASAPATRLAPHVNFAIQPAGRGAPKIDPKPILDGWKLLEATAIYRAAGKNPFEGSGASVGQILLMSKEQLERRVLADPAPRDLRVRPRRTSRRPDRPAPAGDAGVPRRARLPPDDHLAASAATRPTRRRATSATTPSAARSTSPRSTASRSSATRARAPSRTRWSATSWPSRARWSPSQVISLMDFGGPSFAMARPRRPRPRRYAALGGPGAPDDEQFVQILKPEQWERLIGRIAEIDNPEVPTSRRSSRCPRSKGDKDKAATEPRARTSASSLAAHSQAPPLRPVRLPGSPGPRRRPLPGPLGRRRAEHVLVVGGREWPGDGRAPWPPAPQGGRGRPAPASPRCRSRG